MNLTLAEAIGQWWKANQKRFYVDKDSGTWLHKLGFIIHGLAKLTALIPNFRSKIKSKKVLLTPQLAAELEQKLLLYAREIRKHQDPYGFILYQQCDSTLFSGLLSITGIEVDLKAARDDQGFWYRRPLQDGLCYPEGSGSTISRDMLLGIYWHLWINKDLKTAEELYQHAKQHNFVMGKGDPSRLLMMPSGESLLAEICYSLGGKNRFFARNQIQSWPNNLTDYEVHLLITNILLRGKVLGNIDSKMLEVLKTYSKKSPFNPYYNFAYRIYEDGDLNEIALDLLNQQWWPEDRLPKRKDRMSDWITQRDYGPNWAPAVDGDLEKEHTGGDFIVAAWMVLESYHKGW